MRYEIEADTFAVRVFNNGETVPFWFQPDYPNGDKFDTFAEAEVWAKLAVKSHDPTYGFEFPEGKGMAGKAKPTEEEKLLQRMGLGGTSVADLKRILGLE